MTKITLKKSSSYLDGGTIVYINPITVDEINKNSKTVDERKKLLNEMDKYYLDGRIGSATKGELFNKYPGDPNAIVLDKNLFKII